MNFFWFRSMAPPLTIPLDADPRQIMQLRNLQQAFAQVCNALSPIVRETKCWNRVTLHHLTYRNLREQFPQLGSQMICNAIYSVSRNCRLVFQSPASPFNLVRLAGKPLPLLQFAPTAPVYFDRHTLNIKAGQISMFSLDGRIRFHLTISAADELRFHNEKLREIVMFSQGENFKLHFLFSTLADSADSNKNKADQALPEYVLVLPENPPAQEINQKLNQEMNPIGQAA
jgi:hypothetical protein